MFGYFLYVKVIASLFKQSSMFPIKQSKTYDTITCNACTKCKTLMYTIGFNDSIIIQEFMTLQVYPHVGNETK